MFRNILSVGLIVNRNIVLIVGFISWFRVMFVVLSWIVLGRFFWLIML